MTSFSSLIISLLLAQIFLANPVSAMKRSVDEFSGDVVSSVPGSAKSQKTDPVELKWISYPEFLTEIIQLKPYNSLQKFERLKSLFTEVKNRSNKVISYQAWLTHVDDSYLLTIFPEEDRFIIRANMCAGRDGDQYYAGEELALYEAPYSGGARNRSSVSVILSNTESSASENSTDSEPSAAHHRKFVSGLIEELLFSVPVTFSMQQDNWINLDEFTELMNKNQHKSTYEKMLILSNGSINVANSKKLNVDVKQLGEEPLTFIVDISARPYKSNCLSEEVFLREDLKIEAGYLLYYHIGIYLPDAKTRDGLALTPSAEIIFPLDGGYGEPGLPTELHWIQSEANFSGKEILDFTKKILSFLEPKMLFLNDESKANNDKLHIWVTRALAKGKTMYEEYAGFELVDSEEFKRQYLREETELKNQAGQSIYLSAQRYYDSRNVLINFPMTTLLTYFKSATKNRFIKLLDGMDKNITLGKFMNELYSRTDAFTFAYDAIRFRHDDEEDPFLKNTASNAFKEHMNNITNAFLWKSEAFAKKQ